MIHKENNLKFLKKKIEDDILTLMNVKKEEALRKIIFNHCIKQSLCMSSILNDVELIYKKEDNKAQSIDVKYKDDIIGNIDIEIKDSVIDLNYKLAS